MAREKTKIITVFGSSRPEDGHADYVEALELGREIELAGEFSDAAHPARKVVVGERNGRGPHHKQRRGQ